MASFQHLLTTNVVEAKFIRRHDKPQWRETRGAFISTNYGLLNSDLGLRTLNFKSPKGAGMGYNHREHNLVVGWDILRQEYRVFGVESSVIRNFYDVSDDEGRAKFWIFFKEFIMNLTTKEKLIYMGYKGVI